MDVEVSEAEQSNAEASLVEMVKGLVHAASAHRTVHKRPARGCVKCNAIAQGLAFLDAMQRPEPPGDGEIVEYEERAVG